MLTTNRAYDVAKNRAVRNNFRPKSWRSVKTFPPQFFGSPLPALFKKAASTRIASNMMHDRSQRNRNNHPIPSLNPNHLATPPNLSSHNHVSTHLCIETPHPSTIQQQPLTSPS